MKRFYILILLLFVLFHVQAQQRQQVAGIHSGFSLAGVFAGLVNNYSSLADVSATSSPILGFSYDRKLNERISIGGGIARQAFSLNYRNYKYKDKDGNEQTDNFRTDASRLQIGVRGLFYYVDSKKAAMYSGLRAGITNWSLETSAEDPRYDVSRYLNRLLNFAMGVTPSAQLILFGLQGYLTERIGANLEVAIGPPYFLSFGLVYGW